MTLLKEHYLPDLAYRLQESGYAVLFYDHRGCGSSGGSPRNQTDPLQQAEDLHDVVAFARSEYNVDKDRVCVWGIGHSAGAAMIAAADDPNIKAVVLVMPFISGAIDRTWYPPDLLDQAWKERIGRPNMPRNVQPWNQDERESKGARRNVLFHGQAAFNFYEGARKLSGWAGTRFDNCLTLQSLYLCSRVEPQDFLYRIKCPVLHLAAQEDSLPGPMAAQEAAFQRITASVKEFVRLPGDYLSNYSTDSGLNIEAPLKFLRENL